MLLKKTNLISQLILTLQEMKYKKNRTVVPKVPQFS